MGERRASLAAGATIVAIAAIAGGDLFDRRLRVGAHSDWQSLSPDLRAAGREGALAGPGHMLLRLPGLSDSDSVELTLVSRPGLEPLAAVVSRGQGDPARAIVGSTPVTIRLPPGRGSEMTLDVSALDARRRPVYLFHLLEIVVLRRGFWPSVRPWLPALVGLTIYCMCRQRSGWAVAALWALLGVTVAVASIGDPLASVASDGRWGWLCGLVALLCGMKIIVEPQWRTLPKVALVGGLALLVAVMAHVPRLNGPSYWEWPWQRLDWITVFGAAVAASSPLFAARALHRARGARLGFLLALISAGVALSAAAAMTVQPAGLDRMHTVIQDSTITSYYTDALELASQPDWMASYPKRLSGLHLHSKTKPAGPMLFYVALIHVLGPGSATAAVAALLIALGAALAVPAVYVLARELGEPSHVAFEAACVMALSPSLLLFFPEFDQAFPMLTCVLLTSWRRAVNGPFAAAAVLGLSAFLASFFSYSFLVLGIAGLSIAAGNFRLAQRAAARAGLVAVAAYAGLYAISGFDPIAALRAAVANQALLSVGLGRRDLYLEALLNDPWDFAMGAGWIASFLAIVTVVRSWRARERNVPARAAVLQIVTANLSGLLRVEAARVWLFLVPLVAIPAGRELSRWTPEEGTAAYVMMVLLFAALAQNMSFL